MLRSASIEDLTWDQGVIILEFSNCPKIDIVKMKKVNKQCLLDTPAQ